MYIHERKLFKYFHCSHQDESGECIKARLDSSGKLEWVKYSCNDETGRGVICAKRNIWEYVGCYAQAPEEANGGTYIVIPDAELKTDPVKFCREECKSDSKYFDIMANSTSTFCHCILSPIPLGGLLNKEDCEKAVCADDQDPATDNCHSNDGYRRTVLHRTWSTTCPALDADTTTKFWYIWEHHGSWSWGSKAKLRCLPGYELPPNLPSNGEFDRAMMMQTVTCLYDDNLGGKWSTIQPCQPVVCQYPPPAEPGNGTIAVLKSLNRQTHQQAETKLTYTCDFPGWAFDYSYDETLPSFAYTTNIDNITITCNYSTYWEYDNGIDGETCINEQPDGTCGKIVIPECVDRSVYCKPLTTPGGAVKELIEQPNTDNEYEYGTKIQFTCPLPSHYFDYSVPSDLISFFYSTNINTTILTCNDQKFWTVENGINGETCADKKFDDDELWCEDVIIPDCVDRAILCSVPPTPARANIVFDNRPDPNRFEYKTEINYKCPDRNHYFDYPVPDNFKSFHYTDNVNEINVICNKNGIWEVEGGLFNQTCNAQSSVMIPTDDNSTVKFTCPTLSIPDCEDRTLYCTFPPEVIFGGSVSITSNPSPNYRKTNSCRWTKWFNSGKDPKGDKELLTNIFDLYKWQVCKKPDDIRARVVGTSDIVPRVGFSQSFASYDTTTGFECKDSDQLEGVCSDYEIQMCCPYAPEAGTVVDFSCNFDNWYLDFVNTPFISAMTAVCTKNSTWFSEVDSQDFCADGSNECPTATMPNCQDRTILCKEELTIPNGMTQLNTTSNTTLHGSSLGASYEYGCETDGWVVDMPNYPEAIVVNCTYPVGYPDEWYYGIWNDGVWAHKENVTRCIDPDRCYSPPPVLPTDYSVQVNLTIDSPDTTNTTLNYTCAKKCKYTYHGISFVKLGLCKASA